MQFWKTFAAALMCAAMAAACGHDEDCHDEACHDDHHDAAPATPDASPPAPDAGTTPDEAAEHDVTRTVEGRTGGAEAS